MTTKTARSLFLDAVELPPERWSEYLDEVCAGDLALHQKIVRLLAAHQQVDGFMNQPAVEEAGTLDPAREQIGTQIGAYELKEQIGEGGMGIVYVAEQKQPIRRFVALKVIKPGMDSKQVVARFEAERQALAILDHPNIARVIDGGTTDQGRPFFVMELVRGVPITEFCDAERLTIRERLKLFCQVCEAVQHAHQKGIIHRDLKPSNVLVTRTDEHPIPKVIDFGIAKAVNQPLTDKTIYSQFAHVIGTPLYMSPEQAQLTGLDIDTRSDVYSLGVLLYELLTGTIPFASEVLRDQGLDEFRRLVREEEPAHPSHRISTLAAEAGSTISARRGVDPRRLRQLMRGELDWIALRCLEKERNRRYQSASDLADDVQRYLDDLPVAASPPSAWYRSKKFARRNCVALAAATVVMVAVLSAAGVSMWQAYKAEKARIYANDRFEEAETARKTADAERKTSIASLNQARQAIKKLLAQVATDEVARIPGMRDIYRKLLEDAKQSYTQLLSIKSVDPEIHADYAEVCLLLGDWRVATQSFEDALKLDPNNARYHYGVAKSLRTSWPPKRQHVAAGFGQSLILGDWKVPSPERLEQAFQHASSAMELTQGKNTTYRLLRAHVLYRMNRAHEAQQELAEVERMGVLSAADCIAMSEIFCGLDRHQQCLEFAQRALALEPANRHAFHRQAEGYLRAEDYAKAIAAATESIRLDPFVNQRDWLAKVQLRGEAYLGAQRFAEAMADFDAVLASDPSYSHLYKRRALAQFHLKDFAAALTSLQRGYKEGDSSLFRWIPPGDVVRCPDAQFVEGVFTLAAESKDVLSELYSERAALRLGQRDMEGAFQDVLRSTELDPIQSGKGAALKALIRRGEPYRERLQPFAKRWAEHVAKNAAERETQFQQYLEKEGPNSDQVVMLLRFRRQWHLYQVQLFREEHRYADALRLLEEDARDAAAVMGEDHYDTVSNLANLAIEYRNHGQYARAESIGIKVLELCRQRGESHPHTVMAMDSLAYTYQNQGKYGQAEALLTESLQILRRLYGDEHEKALQTMTKLATILRLMGKLTEAESLLTEGLEKLRRVDGNESVYTVAAIRLLAIVYLDQGEYIKMEPLARESLTTVQRMTPGDWNVHQMSTFLGACLLGQGRLEEAEKLLLDAYHGMQPRQGLSSESSRALQFCAKQLAKLYDEKEEILEAERWREAAEAARKSWPPKVDKKTN